MPDEKERERYCTWVLATDITGISAFDTECKETWMFMSGGVKENKVNYCPMCGGKVFVVESGVTNVH